MARTGIMRQRKDIDWGKDMTPGQIWAAFRYESLALTAQAVPQSRLRPGDFRLDGEAAPSK